MSVSRQAPNRLPGLGDWSTKTASVLEYDLNTSSHRAQTLDQEIGGSRCTLNRRRPTHLTLSAP